MKQIRSRLTYANVMSSIAVFLVLGGGAALAAKHVLPKNSVGTKQLKANAVTVKKLKKNAVTARKIRNNAVSSAKIQNGAVSGDKIANGAVGGDKIPNGAIGGDKIADGSITGSKVNASTLGTVPSSASTDVIKTSKGSVAAGGQATAFEYGPIRLVVKCEPYETTKLTAHAYIESSTDGTMFTSWQDGSRELGPATGEEDRELNSPNWINSAGPYAYDSASDGGVSATAASGQSFSAFVGLAAEKDTGTCWYWNTATIIS